MITLVCGLPGTGKTTWVREHLEDGIAYDLDAIAAAFRLREPHEEMCGAARRMANDLLGGFVRFAGEYSERVFVIRAAPGIGEMEEISPDRVVIRLKRFVKRGGDDAMRARLIDVAEWCEARGVPVTYE